MRSARYLTLVSALVLAVPAVRLEAQAPWNSTSPAAQSGYNEGYRRGERAGQDDGRRGSTFNFSISAEYRNGDIGWAARFGNRDRYRQDFRIGFEAGYRAGYLRFGGNRGAGSIWSNGRARGRANYGYGINERDIAAKNGFDDGYEEGLNDGRKRHTNDPRDESRFRDGDHGYDRWYGAREVYRANYRRAFVDGYEAGYRDGWGYR